jgi:hypothetical protein
MLTDIKTADSERGSRDPRYRRPVGRCHIFKWTIFMRPKNWTVLENDCLPFLDLLRSHPLAANLFIRVSNRRLAEIECLLAGGVYMAPP